jgi:hypothetical protein
MMAAAATTAAAVSAAAAAATATAETAEAWCRFAGALQVQMTFVQAVACSPARARSPMAAASMLVAEPQAVSRMLCLWLQLAYHSNAAAAADYHSVVSVSREGLRGTWERLV